LNGDFSGIKIFDSVQDFISPKTRNFLSIGDENDGQVLSLVLCKWNHEAGKTQNSPCCFLGHASGCVAALTATLSSGGDAYVFSIERQHHAHNCEVTALTIVDCSSSAGQSGPILFSACHGGHVCYYPHAMNPIQNFNMESLPVFSNSHPIFSMTSTAIAKGNESTILLCTGDSDGAIGVWSASSGLLSRCNADSVVFHQIQRCETRGRHLVTAIKFIQKNVLVSGDNQGDIRVWDLDCTDSSVRNDDRMLPSLQLRRHLKSAHNGSVEMCMNVGNILMTSGGNDGNIAGWDTTSWKKIGALCCHQGKDAVHPTTSARDVLKSCVVGAILTRKDNRLVSLCRDGVISDWTHAW
jgi:WD40 repeat protein